MPISLSTNISSLNVQRTLEDQSSALSKTFQRLSSGQRINGAGDDVAGLSVAERLGLETRVYMQGIRNVNDGISVLQLADNTVGNLTEIVTRLRELAEQAANGGLSSSQRKAIDREAQTLQKEYLRISRSSSFNGLNLFDGTIQGGIRLQLGFGVDGSIQSTLGGVMGSGTFSSRTSCATGLAPEAVTLGDLNGDGALDMVVGETGATSVGVFLGRGDGSFGARVSYSTGGNNWGLQLGDVNGDGVLDIVAGDPGGTVSVLIGKGDGTFLARKSYATGLNVESVALGDLNGDGVLDIVTADDNAAGKVSVLIGKGDGTFNPQTSYASGWGPTSVALGDVNGDGVLDIVISASLDSAVSVLLGKGDGTFQTKVSYATGTTPYSANLGDLNGDGVLDIVVADNGDNTASVLLGKGDGTFLARKSYSTGVKPYALTLGDVNGDGAIDIVSADSNDSTISVLTGKGDGTFNARTVYATGATPRAIALGDLNGDGVLDAVTMGTSTNSSTTLLGGTREGVAPLLPFSLTTQADAMQALAPLERKLNQLTAQRGVIGAFQSRLSAAMSTLQSTSGSLAAARSRIRDADVASEAANMVRLKISQQAAGAVLAQANQQTALVMKLLGSR